MCTHTQGETNIFLYVACKNRKTLNSITEMSTFKQATEMVAEQLPQKEQFFRDSHQC